MRARLCNIAHAHRLEVLDTPFTDLHAADALREDALRAKSLGFTGKAVIHSSHISVVREVFHPSKEEVAHARKIVEAAKQHEGGAFLLDNAMIDGPIVQRAEDILRRVR